MSPDGRVATGMPHLDNLRTILVAWVIGGHALLGYSAVGGWAYDEFHEVTFAPPPSSCSSRSSGRRACS